MLSFRQVGTVVWTFLAFMLAAALVLNLRYKPIGEGEARYLDTWTGKIHAAEENANASLAEALGSKARERPASAVEITVLQRLLRREAERSTCRGVRFAFPAEVIEVR
jgi:hypothetical protein